MREPVFEVESKLRDMAFPKFRNQHRQLLGPNLYGLQRWGLWQPNRFSSCYNIIHFLLTIFVITEYMEFWILRNHIHLALRNLSVTLLSTTCVYKAGTFVFWQIPWKDLIEFVSILENHQLSNSDVTTKAVIAEYTSYSRKITRFYCCLVAATSLAVVIAPSFSVILLPDYRQRIINGTAPYPEILSSWLPFDRTRGYGYWVSVIEHSLVCLYGAGVIASYDTNAFVLMSFFAGQLKILSENCSKLFSDGNEIIDYKEVTKRIMYCHYHHLSLVRYSKILNSLMSPVMFLYVIICSLMICASAIQLTMVGTSNVQRLWVAEFLVALISQLFLFCWHCNEVLSMSNKVHNGVYSSTWWSQSKRVRSSLVLLSGQLQKPVEFTAGPFTKLNVATFVTILKGSYSYYTLLRKEGV